MQNRSVEWGKKGLKIGTFVGVGAGLASYVGQRWEHWGGILTQVRGRLTTGGQVQYLYPEPASKLFHFAVPLILTAAFVGGAGFVAGRLYSKVYGEVASTTCCMAEKWAINGFKVGGVLGAGLGALYLIENIGYTPPQLLLKEVAKQPLLGALTMAGLGLFGGKAAAKIAAKYQPATKSTFRPFK
jgi:hypothetical protein